MPSNSDLRFVPAIEIAALVRRGEISVAEMVEQILQAIVVEQPRLNAFMTVADEDVRKAAQAADDARQRGEPLGQLHGVPINIKDLFDTKGLRTTRGSAIYRDRIPNDDDVLVARLKKAGAIIIGKTTTPEFGHKGITDGPSFGTTRNPWDLFRTSGGSSGGAAAAVAAGLGPLGLGTDGAGSIRIPAACCGLVGHKPTTGAVPYQQAIDAFVNYAAAGPLARTVADAALMHSVLVGPHWSDPYSLAAPVPASLPPSLVSGDLSGIRLGYIPRMANPRVAADVERNLHAALNAFSARGAIIEEVTDDIDWIEMHGRIMYYANMAVAFGPYVEKWKDQMDPVLLSFIERGAAFSIRQFRLAQYARTELFRRVQQLFDCYDFLVSPTLTRTAIPADFDVADEEVEVDGKPSGITRLGWTAYVYPFNLTGHPAISIPSGMGDDGLPTGLQLVGRWWHDTDVMRLAATLEEDRPWSGRRPQS